MLTLTIEKNAQDQSARLRIAGYTNYAHVEPLDDGGFRVYLFDHLLDKTVEVTKASDFDLAVEVANTALKDAATKVGIDVTSLDVISD